MAAGAHRIMRRLPSFPSSCSAATSKVIRTFKDQEDCNGLLPWLTRKAGADISSVLRVGSSPFGRSLFASQAIQEGDCIMKVPYNVQLTEDKLPEEIHLLLDNVARDTTKIAVLLMMEQHLGHVSGWAPYVRSLPCKGQMHNMEIREEAHGNISDLKENLDAQTPAALATLQEGATMPFQLPRQSKLFRQQCVTPATIAVAQEPMVAVDTTEPSPVMAGRGNHVEEKEE